MKVTEILLLVVVGALIASIIFLNINKNKQIKELQKNQISRIDTITVKADTKIDTITINKTYKEVKYIEINKSNNIDTAIVFIDHIVNVKLDSVLSVELSCSKPETIVTVDNVIYKDRIVEVKIPDESFDSESFFYGTAAGVVAAIIILIIGR